MFTPCPASLSAMPRPMPRELPVMSACFPFFAMNPPGRVVAAKDARGTPPGNYSGIMCAVGIAHRVGFYNAAALSHQIREGGPLDRESEPVLLGERIRRDVHHQLQLAGTVGRADDGGEIGLVGGERGHTLGPRVQPIERVGPAHQV